MTLLVAVAAAAASAAAPTRSGGADPCGPDGDNTECYVLNEQHILAAFGLTSARSYLAAGEEIRRVMIFGRMRNPVTAIEFRRAAGNEPTVSIYEPAPEGATQSAAPAYSAAVPLREWDRLTTASRHFDRTLTPLPPEAPGDTIYVCSDSWLDVVEVTDPVAESPRSRLRHRAEDTCENGLANAFAEEIAESAARLLPACAVLEESEEFSPMRLAACAKLRGDRAAAGLAYNQLERLREARSASDVQHVFGDSPTLDWMGERFTGPREVGAAWYRHADADRANFFPSRLEGQSARRVQVAGRLERWTQDAGGDSLLMVAPVFLVMALDPNQLRFRIESAMVRAYEPAPHFCDPGSLVLRCR